MQSISLLPDVERLPADDWGRRRRSYQEQMQALYAADRTMFATETVAAASFAMWGLFDAVNVDDTLFNAYREQYPGLAAEHSLHDRWLDVLRRGDASAEGFISSLKGKVAEFNAVDKLGDWGYSNVQIAESATQPVWDLSSVAPNGEVVLWQVKTGAADYAGDVQSAMLDNPAVQFAVSSEIYDRIAASSPELMEQMRDIGSDFELAQDVSDGLHTLADNMGIDLPDGVGDLLPYAGAIIAGARLIYGALQTERQFKHIDRTERNKVHVIQALTALSRIGVTTVLVTVGRMAGGAAGSVVPIAGNLVGSLAGAAGGAVMAGYLNSHLQPYVLDLALDITGLTRDDLFYYQNKPAIDGAADAFQANATAQRIELERPWRPRALAAGDGPHTARYLN